jgi:peroxiredoxin
MQAGDIVEDFEALDQHGTAVRLSDLTADGPVVLFFYPKAMTAGCTVQSCHFRDLREEFARHSARPVGISSDTVEDQADFDRRNSLGMTLLSDPGNEVARAMGADRTGLPWNRRRTFVIDRDRRVLEVISSETNMEVHADRALEVLATGS